MQDIASRILYQGEGLLVVNKPYGIPTSGRALEDDDALQYWLMHHHQQMVWAVHQLDADTSGINLFVTERRLVSTMQQSLRQASKRYYAVVHGQPSWQQHHCTAPIGYVNERSLGVCAQGKSADSRFHVVASHQGYSLIEASIRTGRTHQIRIHLAHLGHPLVGEEWYKTPACTLHPRQALHAHRLTLADGHDWHAPMAADLVQLSTQLGLALETW